MSAQVEPTVLQIGQMFVKQYYLQLNNDPSAVHRFYREDSLFAHGGHELGSTETIKGQKAIHDKIMSMDFTEVHARIKQVDCQAILDCGIVVQVTGEISTGRNPMRNFVQTFVLRRKDSKQYYVLNDIFRYQEPVEYDYTSESENNENQSDRGEVGVPLEPAYSTPQPPEQSSPEPEVSEEHKEPEEQEVPLSSGNDSSWEGYNGRAEQEHVVQQMVEPVEAYEQYSTSPALPQETAADLLSQTKESPPGPTNTTWAGLVSRQQGPNPAPLLPSPAPKVQQQSLPPPPREPKPPKKVTVELTQRSPPSAPSTAGGKERPPKKGPPPTSFQVPDSQQIFIGGLPPDVVKEDVKNTFADVGTIVDIRLNQKNFGFVVFDSPDAVRQILDRKATRPFFIRNKHINIEPKKPSGSQRSEGAPGRRGIEAGGRGGSMGPRKNFKN